jgi:hypothetical protein
MLEPLRRFDARYAKLNWKGQFGVAILLMSILASAIMMWGFSVTGKVNLSPLVLPCVLPPFIVFIQHRGTSRLASRSLYITGGALVGLLLGVPLLIVVGAIIRLLITGPLPSSIGLLLLLPVVGALTGDRIGKRRDYSISGQRPESLGPMTLSVTILTFGAVSGILFFLLISGRR